MLGSTPASAGSVAEGAAPFALIVTSGDSALKAKLFFVLSLVEDLYTDTVEKYLH